MRTARLLALLVLATVQVVVSMAWRVLGLAAFFIWTGRHLAFRSALPTIAITVAVRVTLGLVIGMPPTTGELLTIAGWSLVGVYIGMISYFFWWQWRQQ